MRVPVGGEALRALTFAERGQLLKALSKLIHAHRDELIELAIANGGNTRGDAKFDIDGASGTLAAYAELGIALGKTKFLVDGEAAQLTRSVRFVGQHIAVPRQGVAVHINAFNFPAWGLAEKAAVALLAGVPVITKPATSTALVAHRMIELVVEAKVLPDGRALVRRRLASAICSSHLERAGRARVHRLVATPARMLRGQERRGGAVGARQRRGRQLERRGARAATWRATPRATRSSSPTWCAT